jgi:hypothetical protein
MTQRHTKTGKKKSTPVFRSIGLTFAITTCAGLFGIYPLLFPLFLIFMRFQGRVFQPTQAPFWIAPLLGLAVLGVSVFAWVGRPTPARIAFMVVITLAAIWGLIAPLNPDWTNILGYQIGQTNPILWGGQLEQIFNGTNQCLQPFRLVIWGFTVWYCNRAVVKAYFGARSD